MRKLAAHESSGTMTTTTIAISGMSCDGCVGSVKRALSRVEGVSDVQVQLGSAEVTFDESRMPDGEARARAAIEKAGYSTS